MFGGRLWCKLPDRGVSASITSKVVWCPQKQNKILTWFIKIQWPLPLLDLRPESILIERMKQRGAIFLSSFSSKKSWNDLLSNLAFLWLFLSSIFFSAFLFLLIMQHIPCNRNRWWDLGCPNLHSLLCSNVFVWVCLTISYEYDYLGL